MKSPLKMDQQILKKKTSCGKIRVTSQFLRQLEYAKEEFREKWDKKYPSIMRSWDANWAELTTFFNYPEQIRHLIYTTKEDSAKTLN